ncbi:hypothetical protein ACE1ET_15950 [Saccharicrinis sp. FJH62]|uniref:hypothetical protein n=1 Tax=Saccharicrinis sp. FJH62 TaxID=3344657 RepID=UPI0035D41C1A
MEFVVNDTNIFFDLIHADLLDEFFQLDIQVFTTDFIVSEIEDPEQADLVGRFINDGTLIVASYSFDELMELIALRDAHNGLSIEDCSVWHYSKRNNYTLLSGDGLLRSTASRDGVQVRGLLYIFDQLVEHGITEPGIAADKLEDLIQNAGTRLPKTACDERIECWRLI